MLSGEFERNLRKLNPKLRIYCGDNKDKPASLYYIVNGEEITICGVDKNYIPKDVIYDKQGHIVKSGYNRVLKILIKDKLTTKKRAEYIFGYHLYNVPQPNIEKSDIQKK